MLLEAMPEFDQVFQGRGLDRADKSAEALRGQQILPQENHSKKVRIPFFELILLSSWPLLPQNACLYGDTPPVPPQGPISEWVTVEGMLSKRQPESFWPVA